MAGPVSNAFFMEELTKEERATAVGIVRTGDSFFRGIAANIGGMLLAAGLYRVPYLLVSGLYVLSVVLFYSFFKQKESEMQALREAEVVQEAKPEESEGVT
jgi:MFS family permease